MSYSKDQLVAAVASEVRFKMKCSQHDARTVAIQFVGSNFNEIVEDAAREDKDAVDYTMALVAEAVREMRSM